MTAKDKGITRGREFLRRAKIENMTFQEYCNLGKVDAKKQYKRKEAQEQYVVGWWLIGEQFLTLFKQSQDRHQVQKSVLNVRIRLASLYRELEDILEAQDGDIELQHMLQDAYEELSDAQDILNKVDMYLKRPEREEKGS
jgi:hypothetical protein